MKPSQEARDMQRSINSIGAKRQGSLFNPDGSVRK